MNPSSANCKKAGFDGWLFFDHPVIPWTCFSIKSAHYLPDFGFRIEINLFIEEGSVRVTGEVQ